MLKFVLLLNDRGSLGHDASHTISARHEGCEKDSNYSDVGARNVVPPTIVITAVSPASSPGPAISNLARRTAPCQRAARSPCLRLPTR